MVGPQNGCTPIPRTREYVTSHAKRDFAGVIRLEALRWGDDLELSSGPSAVTRAPVGGGGSIRVGEDNAVTETEETRPRSEGHQGGAASPEEPATPGSWKRQANGLSARATRRNAARNLIFGLLTSSLREKNLYRWKLLSLRKLVTAARGTLHTGPNSRGRWLLPLLLDHSACPRLPLLLGHCHVLGGSKPAASAGNSLYLGFPRGPKVWRSLPGHPRNEHLESSQNSTSLLLS